MLAFFVINELHHPRSANRILGVTEPHTESDVTGSNEDPLNNIIVIDFNFVPKSKTVRKKRDAANLEPFVGDHSHPKLLPFSRLGTSRNVGSDHKVSSILPRRRVMSRLVVAWFVASIQVLRSAVIMVAKGPCNPAAESSGNCLRPSMGCNADMLIGHYQVSHCPRGL